MGLLLSSVDDLLTGARNNTLALHNNERKAIYYALRHAQVPVDMITEDDVIDGLAKDYRLIYVTQKYLLGKAGAALRQWVEAGGTVVALCGGGFLDEFQRPNPAANELYGVREQTVMTDPDLVSRYLLKSNVPFLTKQDLPLYEPIDRVTWTSGASTQTAPVIAWRQALTPSDGTVLGTFSDGTAAVVEKRHGRGRAVLFGFLPGQAYLKSGLPARPADRSSVNDGFNHFLPTGMDAGLRVGLVDTWLPPDVQEPVTCSVPLVETTVIDTPSPGKPGRLAVPLLNYSGTPIDRLRVTINGLKQPARIRAVSVGELTWSAEDGAVTVELALPVADMLLIDR